MRKPQGGHLLTSVSLQVLCLAQMACTQQGESPPNPCLPKVDLDESGADPGGLGALAYTPSCEQPQCWTLARVSPVPSLPSMAPQG